METMSLKARPKAAYDELWQLSILCQQLKNGDRNYKNTEGVAELWLAVFHLTIKKSLLCKLKHVTSFLL